MPKDLPETSIEVACEGNSGLNRWFLLSGIVRHKGVYPSNQRLIH